MSEKISLDSSERNYEVDFEKSISMFFSSALS